MRAVLLCLAVITMQSSYFGDRSWMKLGQTCLLATDLSACSATGFSFELGNDPIGY